MSLEEMVRSRSAAARVEIREVRGEAELREVFRLRYRVFRRQGTQPPHPAELDVDAWDPRCRYVGAWEGGRLVAAARMILGQGPFPWEAAVQRMAPGLPAPERPLFCETLFDLGPTLQGSPGPLAEFGRTVCDPDRRGAGLGSVMVHAVHGLGLCHGIRTGFGTPLVHLVDFYEGLGARVLEGHATRRHREHTAEMVPVTVDLAALPLARRAAEALARHGRLVWCGERGCLEQHDHATPDRRRHAAVHPARRQPRSVAFQLHDETLRDGLQSPSAREPRPEEARELLHRMADLGIESVNLGLPGAGPRAMELSVALAREIRDLGLPLRPTCAGRTHRDDIDAIAEVARRSGCRLEAGLFLGSSPLRLWAEGWTEDDLLRRIEESVPYAVSRGLEVMFVTEDTVRSQPQTLRRLFTRALECGASRLCLCDTVGHATPEGVQALVRFVKDLLVELGRPVPLDWHGHRDRGLAVANSLAAVRAGVSRVHATAGGVGERVGNTPMASLLRVLDATGLRPCDPATLDRYELAAARALRMEVGR